jgi:hypothetical protein
MRSIPNLSRFFILGGLAAAGLAIGCASPIGENSPLEAEFEEAPSWVVNGCDEFFGDLSSDNVCGVGSAEGSRNTALMRTTAIGRGRTEIARSLQTRVLAMLKDYASTTTGGRDFGNSANDEQHIVDVSRQITEMSLSGTELTETWISQTGTYYVLVSLDVEKFSQSVSEMEQLTERTREAVVERAEREFRELDEGA